MGSEMCIRDRMSGADKTKLDGLIVADDSEVTEMLGEVFAQQA